MSTSAIFAKAPLELDDASTSAIYASSPQTENISTTSAIFITSGGVSMETVFGSISSAPYIEDYDSATMPLGPISQEIFISPEQLRVFGTTSSNQFQTVADRGNVLRGSQFRFNTIGLDRFASPLAAVITTFGDLDLTVAATTTIYTVPTDNPTIIMGCLIHIKAADTVTTDAEVSLGINPSTVDIFATEPLTQVRAQNDFYSFWKDTSIGFIAEGGVSIDLDVVTAATATTLNSDIYLIGLQL